MRRLEQRLLSGRLHPSIESLLLHYAHGKPKETIEVSGGVDHRLTLESIALRALPVERLRQLREISAEVEVKTQALEAGEVIDAEVIERKPEDEPA